MAKLMQYGKPKIVPKAPGMDSLSTKSKAIPKMKAVPKKMTVDQIAKRKKSTISNAATKLMGGQYSK